MVDQTAHVVGDVDHTDFDFGTGLANRSDKQTHTVFLITKNMLDFGTNARTSGIGNSGSLRHGAALWFLLVNA